MLKIKGRFPEKRFVTFVLFDGIVFLHIYYIVHKCSRDFR